MPGKSTSRQNAALEAPTTPTSHRQARLPPELMDMIIKRLHDNRAALAACALVCRSWVPASRQSLFGEVVIQRENFSDVSNLLCSPSCTITSAAELLRLHELDLFRSEVWEVVSKLSRITRLWLFDGYMVVSPPPALAPLLCNLDSLVLSGMCFGGLGPLRSLSYHCPQLRELYFWTASSITDKDAPFPSMSSITAEHLSSAAGVLMPKLTSLNTQPELVEWLVRDWENAESFPQLVKLDLDFKYFEIGASTEILLEAVGQTLQNLSLSKPPDHIDTSGELAQIMRRLTCL